MCACARVHMRASTDSASLYNWSMTDTCTQDSRVFSPTVQSSGVLWSGKNEVSAHGLHLWHKSILEEQKKSMHIK